MADLRGSGPDRHARPRQGGEGQRVPGALRPVAQPGPGRGRGVASLAGLDARVRLGAVSTLRLSASSRAEEAGFLAMRDLAAVADDVGIEYRLVGGQMVRLH